MKQRNITAGWITFLVSFIVYFLTAERTGSWWDCGEFLASDYKLQIPHQPGAPLYVMIYKCFTLLAGADKTRIAFFANLGSASVSALTIAFLFWTICALCKRLLAAQAAISELLKETLILFAGLAGSMIYAFSDTFWFSAVEAEVYALSSLFTAVTVWAMVRWQAQTGEQNPKHNRWILLISLLMGLSVGVHLLNLLCIPALVFIAWGKYKKLGLKGILAALVISILVVFIVLELLIPGSVSFAGHFDLIAVNNLHLPFNSGVLVVAITVIGLLAATLFYAVKTRKPYLQLAVLSLFFFYIGYSSFFQVIIRANASPPLDHTQANNPFSFYSYLTRQQYPAAPLLYGPYYDAGNPVSSEKTGTLYRPQGMRYAVSGETMKYTYARERSTFFPRIWETENGRGSVDFYQNWLGLTKDQKPTFSDNLRFMFSYQINHMFWRYFMWNFAGRQNDEVGYGDTRSGNWISGIKPFDALRLGPQDHLPKTITASKAYNRLYLIPFFLGLAGLLFQFKRGRTDFISMAVLFFFTGIAIILFLNQSGPEPRERDYSFGGAFYTFSIWIGLGIPAAFMFLESLSRKFLLALSIERRGINLVFLTGLLTVGVPILTLCQEYNDHDRSGRSIVRDMASNVLNSCAPGTILLTYADNDTYPLWYVQEVEGIRPDVRVVIQPFLASDWYVEQLHKKINQAPALPFLLPSSKYFGSQREYVPFIDSNLKGYTDLDEVVELLGSEDSAAKIALNDGSQANFLPTKNFKLEPGMTWTLPQNHLYKSDLAELDFIAANKWKHPVYFGIETPASTYLGMDKYVHLEGLAYRLQPQATTDKDSRINTETMYHNVIDRYKWGSENHGEYLDPVSRQKLAMLRQNCLDLSASLFEKGDKTRSLQVINKVYSSTPDAWSRLDLSADSIGLCYTNMNAGSLYYQLGKTAAAQNRMDANALYLSDQLEYVLAAHLSTTDKAVEAALEVLKMQAQIAGANHDQSYSLKFQALWNFYHNRLG